MFKALLLEERDGEISPSICNLDESRLPKGNVTVAVEYSSLNYKDGMVLNNLGRLVRDYPHVPGIDFVGKVAQSSHPDYSPGDPVLLTGWRVGELHWGGYAQKARVDGDWLVPLPEKLTPRRAMGFGTAGFAAMLAVLNLEERGLTPDSGEVLVTGASGGVGSIAVAILAARGYRVTASTGRPGARAYLEELGATAFINRQELADPPTRPLNSERWAGCVDSVSGDTLANVLTQIAYGGAVAAVGLAGGSDLKISIIPFLLRSVELLGIDSVLCPFLRRLEIWRQLARSVPTDLIDAMITEVPLGALVPLGRDILQGRVRGRTVVRIAD